MIIPTRELKKRPLNAMLAAPNLSHTNKTLVWRLECESHKLINCIDDNADSSSKLGRIRTHNLVIVPNDMPNGFKIGLFLVGSTMIRHDRSQNIATELIHSVHNLVTCLNHWLLVLLHHHLYIILCVFVIVVKIIFLPEFFGYFKDSGLNKIFI